jgi:5-methyltetrahydropteroyltriglutamate--homocysteine methyltransferase
MKRTFDPMLLPTTLVGSYPQPDWLIDRARLAKQVPRVRARDLWLIDREKLEAAQDDATLLAIRDQEHAGLDIITDGEQRRESYSNRFATALGGIDLDNPGKTPNRTGGFSTVPRVVGPIRRKIPGRGSRCGIPARQHRSHDQNSARSLHHVGAMPGRLLS